MPVSQLKSIVSVETTQSVNMVKTSDNNNDNNSNSYNNNLIEDNFVNLEKNNFSKLF